jgi:hypothetical protein
MIKLLEKGTLFTKDKTKKLDYSKKGRDYIVEISNLLEERKNGQITNRSYQRISNFSLKMNEKSLVNYLYAELYLDKLLDS